MGGLVNMARGLGTALGVAVVTLALHAAGRLGHPGAGPVLAMAVLAAVALAATWAGTSRVRDSDGIMRAGGGRRR